MSYRLNDAAIILSVMLLGVAASLWSGYECSVSFDEKCIVRQVGQAELLKEIGR